MSDAVKAYPLQWPAGWRRWPGGRQRGKFVNYKAQLTVGVGVERVLSQLSLMRVFVTDVVISTNIKPRLDGFPRGDQAEARDPGVAVYWPAARGTRCMAIDRYDRVADNLAAIATTLEALRAIERHGGGEILDRAFMGFTALPAPEQWFQVLGVSVHASHSEILAAHRRLANQHHPDKGGTNHNMARINTARDEGLQGLEGRGA